MSRPHPTGIGIIGMGFMGRTHLGAYERAATSGLPCRLVAVADGDASRRRGDPPDSQGNIETSGKADRLFDPERVRGYADAADLLADEAVEVVSICTHTDTHADLAVRALEAGKHVLVEKPVALDSESVARVADAAAAAPCLCMPAMCMRFWPGWTWLRDRVQDGSLGRIRSAVFQRLGTAPGWAPEFYEDTSRSGGALVDLHIHDVDFIYWCFGKPRSLVSTGSIHHLTTLFAFDAGPDHVIAEGGWDHSNGFDFRMRYVAVFERGTADFDLTRDPPLLLARDGRQDAIELDESTGYDGEIQHLLNAVRTGDITGDAPITDAVAVTRLLEAERHSLETGNPVHDPL